MRLPALILTVAAVTLLMAPASPQEKANSPLHPPPPTERVGGKAPASPQEKANLPPKEQIEESARKVKELQKERILTLKLLVASTSNVFKYSRRPGSPEEVWEAELMLLQAELDAAEKESERVALYKKMIEVFKKVEDSAEVSYKAGRVAPTAVHKSKARRLEVEIQLEQAKIKEAKEAT